MRNIVDYAESEMNRLEAKPFNPVDSLILSQLSYLHFKTMVPGPWDRAEPVKIRDLLQAEQFDTMFYGLYDPENSKKLLFAMAASPRYRDLRVCCHTDTVDAGLEKQFSALSVYLDRETVYIAFRGTDSTFTGWKEDFNMAFLSPVPSQEDAVRYLETVASRRPGKLIVGGHSKGGNLAVYSAMKCSRSVQDRIVKVYSHDGPGFRDDVFQTEEFRRVSGSIHKTIPQSSLVGMLLENQENYYVVESKSFGLLQHDPFSWVVAGDDFHILRQLSVGTQYRNRTLNDWIAALSNEQREVFADTLYAVLSSGDASSFAELGAEWQKSIPAMLTAVKNIDPETRAVLLDILKELAVIAVKNIPHPRPLTPGIPDGIK
ncbi:DUF2974 domain-containing protein [Papillibacter cinnamivorans]|uniref:DUF2974 domain-containing protein n=1 Tax=Papillibacter cinnamivorans DSM 12816 TaxID=1122930 RepID=A0A1W2BEX1_9FIRM|nr:DUF2974 domain-containing protein [Papillibacter cinnamivorans]SMC71381.1 Protein of unknown function [Papillibacter cinnamivorans DSM 12816]